MSQDSIASSRLARSAAIASAGAKVGLNYLKHYGRRALTRETAASSEEKLHAENAADVYRTFSELKGGPLKVAQMLSIDQNLLPRAYTQHFAQAQYYNTFPPIQQDAAAWAEQVESETDASAIVMEPGDSVEIE